MMSCNPGATCLGALLLASFSAWAQTSGVPATNAEPLRSTAAAVLSSTNPVPSPIELSERLRAECIHGRRSICGRILRIVPDGIIVESGYTNLLRQSLSGSWLLPGTVVASRASNLIESREPNALCVGIVCLSNLPRGKPHPYDYVVISGYPMGGYTYASVGTVTRTVRHFSASLEEAVKWNFAEAQRQILLRQAALKPD
jgi:hypothetical protein